MKLSTANVSQTTEVDMKIEQIKGLVAKSSNAKANTALAYAFRQAIYRAEVGPKHSR